MTRKRVVAPESGLFSSTPNFSVMSGYIVVYLSKRIFSGKPSLDIFFSCYKVDFWFTFNGYLSKSKK